jgi:hypothetical protein
MKGLCKRVTASGGLRRTGRIRLFGMMIFFALIVLPLQAQNMSEQDLQNMYMSYLQGEGYAPWIDEDGDVAFEKSNFTFYIIVYEDDLEYFQLLFPAFYSIDTQQERQQAAEAISKVNREKKVAKIYMNTQETRVSASAEVFVRNPEDFKVTFTRMFNNVLSAAQDFLEAIEG